MGCRVNPSRREAVPTSYGVSLPPGVCRNLKSIVVQVGIVDYFKEPHSPEAKKMFEEMVNKLQVRGDGPGSPSGEHFGSLGDILKTCSGLDPSPKG